MKKFIATHRVKNSDNETVGFIINGKFFNTYNILKYLDQIENISVTKTGIFRAKAELPVIRYSEINRQIASNIIKDNPFNRDIQQDLIKWKKDGAKTVLQLLGPRQVGKTTEIKKFAYKNYEYVIYINLANDKFNFIDMVKNRNSSIELMLSELEVYCKKANLPEFINDRRTILVIDEIQSNEFIYNSIREFKSEYKCDIIVTGSYLAITYTKKEYFIPVGTISDVALFSMSFREFCDIYGYGNILDNINIYSEELTKQHSDLDKLYEIYRQIGGYPEVVKTYKNTQSLEQAYMIIENIIELFKSESSVYFTSTRQKEIFDNIFRQAIIQMCRGNKDTRIRPIEELTSIINKNTKTLASRQEVIDSINWLIFSGVIGTCDHCIDGNLLNINPARRIYYLDCGITSYLIQKIAGIDKTNSTGVLTETFAYTELNRLHKKNFANRVVKGDTPIFSTLGVYELDFMEQYIDDTIYELEVKTKTGDPKSLKIYIQKGLVNKGIVAKRTLGHKGNKISSIPIWAIGCRFPYK